MAESTKKVGRPKKPPVEIGDGSEDPLDFLLLVMHDQRLDPRVRLRAAVAAAQYKHVKLGDTGKKKEREQAAEDAASGRYSGMEPPKLRAVVQ